MNNLSQSCSRSTAVVRRVPVSFEATPILQATGLGSSSSPTANHELLSYGECLRFADLRVANVEDFLMQHPHGLQRDTCQSTGGGSGCGSDDVGSRNILASGRAGGGW